jgi:ABC-2 type transport system ATP-binding protein
VNGFDVVADSRAVKRSIGLTGQYAAVDEYLTGRENLELMGRLYHLEKDLVKRRSKMLLEKFDLLHAKDRAVKTYSGGMRRKLDLAASLIAEPPVIFLDEPTTGLDPRSRIATWNIIKELMEQEITILLTTQQLDEADHLAHTIAVLSEGKIIAKGTSAELKQRVGNQKFEMTLKSGQDMDKALNLFAGKNAQFDTERRIVSLNSDGDIRSASSILDATNNSGIAIDTFALRKPTLDDVFLFFTGHKAGADHEQEVVHADE